MYCKRGERIKVGEIFVDVLHVTDSAVRLEIFVSETRINVELEATSSISVSYLTIRRRFTKNDKAALHFSVSKEVEINRNAKNG